MADPFIIVDLNLLVSREQPFFGLCQQGTHPVLVGLLEIEVEDCPRCRSIEGCLIRFQYPTENSDFAGSCMGNVHDRSSLCVDLSGTSVTPQPISLQQLTSPCSVATPVLAASTVRWLRSSAGKRTQSPRGGPVAAGVIESLGRLRTTCQYQVTALVQHLAPCFKETSVR